MSILRSKITKTLRIQDKDISSFEIVKHSLDCRKKPEIFDVFVCDVSLNDLNENKVVKRSGDKNIAVVSEKKYNFLEKTGIGSDKTKLESALLNKDKKGNIIVIGAGPAGLFCAYELSLYGFKPLLLERGSDVGKRCAIVNEFWEKGKLDKNTNVQFGEGGAGTFSDGKLNTMVKDKEMRGREALEIFVKNGAPQKILYEAKPHIGTDILCRVVSNMRKEIIKSGGEVLFDTQVTDFEFYNDTLCAVYSNDKRFECSAAVLAIGHSARDTFYVLKDRGIDMSPKPFAVGFRVEHPQRIINKSQYGTEEAIGLPPAAYKLVTTTKEGRGVYSFCMCPGGYVVNASSEEGMLAVNGMSYSERDGENANSAIIITVDPKDFGGDDVLSGVEFQRRLEKKAYDLAGGMIPVEYYRDFKDKNNEPSENHDGFKPQMKGAFKFAPVHDILPDELNDAFIEGMENFGSMINGYNDDRTLISGVESRTSSPVRINRDEKGMSVNIKNLFPCGEGAGYAGGIMSAAMDGIRTSELVVRSYLS